MKFIEKKYIQNKIKFLNDNNNIIALFYYFNRKIKLYVELKINL